MKNPYLEAKITTASPEKILLMLYEGFLRFLRLAILLQQENDHNRARLLIGKALAIVQELHGSLRPDAAPELCRQLDRIYRFVEEKLIEAAAQKSASALQAADKVMNDLYDGWQQAVKQLNCEPARRAL